MILDLEASRIMESLRLEGWDSSAGSTCPGHQLEQVTSRLGAASVSFSVTDGEGGW